MFKIEKNIPIPSTKRGSSKYKIDNLQKGDSLFVNTNSERIYVAQIFKKAGFNSISRKEEEGYRIWAV